MASRNNKDLIIPTDRAFAVGDRMEAIRSIYSVSWVEIYLKGWFRTGWDTQRDKRWPEFISYRVKSGNAHPLDISSIKS